MRVIQLFQGLLTPVIAAIAVYIAWQQWQANKLKLVLERFNQRWAVYQAVLDFIVAVCRDFKISADEIGKFRRATIQAEFLFGPEIPKYIDELCDRSIKPYQDGVPNGIGPGGQRQVSAGGSENPTCRRSPRKRVSMAFSDTFP